MSFVFGLLVCLICSFCLLLFYLFIPSMDWLCGVGLSGVFGLIVLSLSHEPLLHIRNKDRKIMIVKVYLKRLAAVDVNFQIV